MGYERGNSEPTKQETYSGRKYLTTYLKQQEVSFGTISVDRDGVPDSYSGNAVIGEGYASVLDEEAVLKYTFEVPTAGTYDVAVEIIYPRWDKNSIGISLDECVDPRFKYVTRSCAEYVEWLGQKENPTGKGWAAGVGYGAKIITILNARNIGQDSTMKSQNRYPLSGMLICPYCGKTLRRRQVYNKKIQWLCSTYIEKGVKACKGIRIDDAELQGLNIVEQTVVEEVIRNGKKHYSYTSKADFDCGIRNSTGSTEVEDGSVLQSVNQEEQLLSYENQVNYYTNYISENPLYEYAGTYADVYNQRLIPFDTKKAVQTPKITAFEGKSTCRKPFFHSLKLYCSVAGFINAPSK